MQELLRQIESALPCDMPQRIGVAVSGGSDSIALLLLMQELSQSQDFELFAVTVDHGLRPEAAQEAAAVAKRAAHLSIPHETLEWTGWDGSGNTQNEARKARYALMSQWAHRHGIPAIALGHTLDDQAETVVMRLARGAGVDGLSAMATAVERDGILLLRPLLAVRRETLRAYLRSEEVPWHDDPSNRDTRYDRVNVRESLALLAPLGVTAEALVQVAQNMQAARGALETQTKDAAQRLATVCAGAVKFDRASFDAVSPEIARRLILSVLQWIAGSEYAPRARSVAAAMRTLVEDGSATLEGCRLLRKEDVIWVFREYNAVKAVECAPEYLWDGRWRLSGPASHGKLTVSALGAEGLAACPDWRSTGLPREVLLSCPAVWSGDTLHAAPHAGAASGWGATLEKGETSLFHGAFSH